MRITEEQLFDYINCPAYYDMKYIRKIPCSSIPTMQSLMFNAVSHFYSNLLDKKICTLNSLKRKWDTICESNPQIIDGKKGLEGLNYLVNFARWHENNKTILADFKSVYTANVDDIEVATTIESVAIIPGRKCELLINKFSNREPNQYDIDKKLKYTLDCLAFKQATGMDISAIRVIHFKNNKEFSSYRTQTDYDRLNSTIKGVINGIQAKAFYPRESVFCSQCQFKHLCKHWN